MSALQSCLPDDITLSPPHPSHPHPPHVTREHLPLIRPCVKTLRRELGLREEEERRETEGEREEEGGLEREAELSKAKEETDLAMFMALQSLGL